MLPQALAILRLLLVLPFLLPPILWIINFNSSRGPSIIEFLLLAPIILVVIGHHLFKSLSILDFKIRGKFKWLYTLGAGFSLFACILILGLTVSQLYMNGFNTMQSISFAYTLLFLLFSIQDVREWDKGYARRH